MVVENRYTCCIMIPLLVSECDIAGSFSVQPLEPIERKTSMQVLTDRYHEVRASCVFLL